MQVSSTSSTVLDEVVLSQTKGAFERLRIKQLKLGHCQHLVVKREHLPRDFSAEGLK